MPAAKRDDVAGIFVNAPDFGVIAGRIEKLVFIGAGAIKDDLAKLAAIAREPVHADGAMMRRGRFWANPSPAALEVKRLSCSQ